ncbi:hypothetical protein FH972_021435 [Carpinus fangiana]|uniref:Heme haloperoxidase family profile domain-containing protein n=1 Tax=Carpinus fangiana TaxID=176857 RepID=A0A5N6KPD7_9ROSI|nr:hypothetical protein FH972_021435 [Carpinus fangiana]
MKTFSSLAALAAGVAAFPHLNPDSMVERAAVPPQGAGYLPSSPPPFNAAAQLVSTSGQYVFKAPGPNDARGPCPGLNAAANHGYLPHNGVATITQFIEGTNKVFGMARDLGGFLAIFGAIIDGDGTSWSIQGVPHTGIGGSHHNYECDSSPVKGDLDQYGSNSANVDSQWRTLYGLQPDAATANYNLEVLSKFRNIRFKESVAKNPYFFYGPFDGIAVSQAAFTFIYRFMSNKSAENPEGVLNKEVLKSFMSYSGPENNLKHTPGHERIPDNWYKRNAADEYSIPYFITDIIAFAKETPEIISVGCNQGKVNTYQHVGLDQLLPGLSGAGASLGLSSPLCAPLNFLNTGAKSMYSLSDAKNTQLQNAIKPVASQIGCLLDPLLKPSASQLQACPGFSLYGGPTGPVAPGAIQS